MKKKTHVLPSQHVAHNYKRAEQHIPMFLQVSFLFFPPFYVNTIIAHVLTCGICFAHLQGTDGEVKEEVRKGNYKKYLKQLWVAYSSNQNQYICITVYIHLII